MADPDAELPWVTASAIGQATYCPYQLYLARSGAERDAGASEALARGGEAHALWNERQHEASRRSAAGRLRAALLITLVVALALLGVLAWRAVGLR